MKLSCCLAASLWLLVVPTSVQSRHKSLLKDEQVMIYNTIEDAGFTGGAEAMFEASGPATIAKGAIEFEGFPSDAYDIDIYKNKLTYTLKDNSIASNLILPEGRFDRYYIIFSDTVVDEIELINDAELNEFAFVRTLPPGYVADHLVDPFGTGIQIPFTAPYGGIYVQIGPGSDLTDVGVQLEAEFKVARKSTEKTVTMYNTIEDAAFTGGAQSIFLVDGPHLLFGSAEFFGGLYDVDFDEQCKRTCELTMTLVGAPPLEAVLPEGRFDRYYYLFSEDNYNVEEVELDGADEVNAFATVRAIPPGYVVSGLVDTDEPFSSPYGGVFVELGPGTDISTTGVQLKAKYKLSKKKSDMDVTIWNTFQDTGITGGAESIFDTQGPVGVIEDVEFVGFPADLYDIDVDDGKLTMTLIDTTVASSLLFPKGRFDRYYLNIGEVESVELKGTSGLNAHAQVTTLPPGYVANVEDLFCTGLTAPFEVTNGGILIELGADTDLSVLGVQLKAEFKMGKGGNKGAKKGGKKRKGGRRATLRGL